MNQKLKNNKQYLTYIGSDWGGLYVDLNLIEREGTVISAGIGSDVSFDLELIKKKKCSIVGIDPTKTALETVNETAAEDADFKIHFRFVSRALLDESNKEITLGGPAVTFISPVGEKVKTITLKDIIDRIIEVKGEPHLTFLKLDIEAAEYPVINNLNSVYSIPQIGVSFHHWLNGPTDQYPNPGAVCPYTINDTVNCIKKIKQFGYKLVHIDNADPARYFQEVLFIRNDLANKYDDLTFEYNNEVI